MAAAVHMEGVGDAAIKFMKASHQKTLFELRAEIALLRQKNADLTMSAALSETIAEDLIALRLENDGKLLELATQQKAGAAVVLELAVAKTTITTLEASVEQADARDAAMQQVLAENEAARQQERELIRSLKNELDDRSANSARLMVQLHKAKVQYKQFVDSSAAVGGSAPIHEGGAGGAVASRSRSSGARSNDASSVAGSASLPSPPGRAARLAVRRRATYVSPDRAAAAASQGQVHSSSSSSSGGGGGGGGAVIVSTSLRAGAHRTSPVPPGGTGSGNGGTYTMVASPPSSSSSSGGGGGGGGGGCSDVVGGQQATETLSSSTHARQRQQLPVNLAPVPPIRRRASNGALSRHMRRQIATQADVSP